VTQQQQNTRDSCHTKTAETLDIKYFHAIGICFDHLDALWPGDLVWTAAVVIMRSRLAISVKDGLTAGFGAQHCSISVLHSISQ